jgi:peptide/nickel transport system substrate-binding protein
MVLLHVRLRECPVVLESSAPAGIRLVPRSAGDRCCGLWAPGRRVRPPASWAAGLSRPPGRDVDAARALIEANGWTEEASIYERDGVPLSTIVWVGAGPERVFAAEAAAQQVRECGIDLVVQEADLFYGGYVFPNDAEVALAQLGTTSDPDPYESLHSSRAYSPDDPRPGYVNLAGWSNEEADRLLEQGRSELDPEQRREIYRRLEELLWQELPYVPLFYQAPTIALSAAVTSTGEAIDLDSPRFWWNLEDWVVAVAD